MGGGGLDGTGVVVVDRVVVERREGGRCGDGDAVYTYRCGCGVGVVGSRC